MAPLLEARWLVALVSLCAAMGDCVPAAWGPDSCVFGAHMVLASSDAWSGGVTPARVWGTASPGETVTLTGLPAGATVEPSNPWAADASGNWSIVVSAAASLAPATLVFSGSKGGAPVSLDDVLFGFTMLCSGQSNVDFPVQCSFDADATWPASLQYPEIRLMNAGLSDGNPGLWYSAANKTSNSSVEDFSAVCYYTALALKRSVPELLTVPLGLVRASVGGQVIERFLSQSVLLAQGLPAPNASNSSCDQSSHTLYDTLIEPLTPFVFKSLLWYHGEGNVGCNQQPSPDWETGYYGRLLGALVSSWRDTFATNFTAIVVQLAPFALVDPSPADRTRSGMPALRAQQAAAVAALSHSALVVTIDLGDEVTVPVEYPACWAKGGLHPRNKTEVGRRAALQLAALEGWPAPQPSGPRPLAFTPTATGVNISFAPATAGALALAPTADCRAAGQIPVPLNASAAACCQAGSGAYGFALASFPFELRLADGLTYVTAEARVDTAAGVVALAPLASASGTAVDGPFTGVRYAWQGYPLCSLANGAGLPAAPFAESLRAPFTWSNPVLFDGPSDTNGTLRDPSIFAEGGVYYLTYTMYPFSGCGTAPCESSPGIQLWTSTDLAAWTPGPWLVEFNALPDDAPYKGRFWAPELHKIRGKYFLIFTGDNYVNASYAPTGKNGLWAFVGVSDAVDGPYENITWIQGGACDTTLYWDEDADTVYAVMPFGSIFQQEIDLRPGATFGNLSGARTEVLSSNFSAAGLSESPIYLEGPYVVRAVPGGPSGNVVLMAAANFNSTLYPWRGYETVAAYSGAIGSYNYSLDPSGAVFWGGHLTVFDGPCDARWFAYREEEWHAYAGRLSIDPFTLDPDGRVMARGMPSLGPQQC